MLLDAAISSYHIQSNRNTNCHELPEAVADVSHLLQRIVLPGCHIHWISHPHIVTKSGERILKSHKWWLNDG